MYVTVAGFVTNVVNNGTFLVVASTTTTLTLANAVGVAETHAATANAQVGSALYHSYGDPANKAGSAPVWYNPSNFTGYDPNVASVSSGGLITARHVGQTIVEVSFPTFDNTLGTDSQAQQESNEFIYAQIVVNVAP